MRRKSEPTFFVQDDTGRLFGYFNLDILLCDLAMNRHFEARDVRILEIQPGIAVRYEPVSESDLRARSANKFRIPVYESEDRTTEV